MVLIIQRAYNKNMGHKYHKRSFKILFLSILSILLLISCSSGSSDSLSTVSRNIILIIGDGMGPEQIKAAGYYLHGQAGQLSFEEFPYQTTMTTYSADSDITDSAASASAMATGRKVNNGCLSIDPETGDSLQTILEIAHAEGVMTGLVTTAISVHATPAAFASHVTDRNNYGEIGRQYLEDSRPDVVFGGGNENLTVEMAESAGYTAAENLITLQELIYKKGSHYIGSFGDDHLPYMYDGAGDLPELSDMALKALALLEESDKGFFLMIEAGRIDHAGHANDLVRNVFEVIELSDTVEQVLAWAEGRHDTVIIVTADHETGGLTVLQNNGAGNLPDVAWSTTGHTGIEVPVYIWGDNAEYLESFIQDNTSIFDGLVSE